MKEIKKITENMTLAKILEHSGAKDILAKHNLPCLHCPMAAQEIENLKIGEVAKMYGIDINDLLKDLNKNIKVSK
jgi:hypothetical protein